MAKIVSTIILLMGMFHFQAAYGMVGNWECGLYELTGSIEKNEAGIGYFYIVNKGTNSQFIISISPQLEPRIAPYINRTSKIRAHFSKKIEGYRGEFASIESIDNAVSDPLGLSGQKTLLLISEENCSK